MTCRIRYGSCGVAVLLVALSAHAAQCDNPMTSEDIAQCLGNELRDSDTKINLSYKELMNKLDSSDQAKLRNEQRVWIKDRDAVCGLNTKESNREKWYQAILTDYLKTVCVTRYTRQRTAELNRMLARFTPQAQPKAAPAAEPRQSAVSHTQADYRVLSKESKEKGRWYLEITVNSGEIAGFSPTALFLGCIEEKVRANFGTLAHIRGSDTSLPIMRYAYALDLEAGKLYVRRNGTWNRGTPGSSGGMDLKLGRNYRCGADSTVLVAPLVEKGFLQLNFGEKAFAYSMPDGYRPFSE